MAPALRTRVATDSFDLVDSFDLTELIELMVHPLSKYTNIQIHKYANIQIYKYKCEPRLYLFFQRNNNNNINNTTGYALCMY
jgi:hypothetical protein